MQHYVTQVSQNNIRDRRPDLPLAEVSSARFSLFASWLKRATDIFVKQAIIEKSFLHSPSNNAIKRTLPKWYATESLK